MCVSQSLLVFKQSEYIQFSSSASQSYATRNTPCSYRQPSGNGQLLSRRYCKHSVWLFSCASRTANSPTALWRFRASTSNSPSGRTWLPITRPFAILIILTLNKIFEYVEMTILSRPMAVPKSQGALASSRKYLSHLEMTVFGSTCTRILIDRTLICNAILYHFQITLICGRINRPIIPLTLFLLSRPLEQLEFIRLSNLPAEICFVSPVTRPQRFILPRNFQSRYRRHLSHSKPLFKSPARDDLLINFLVSLFTPYKNFTSVRIQSRKNVFETNIVVIHNQIPHISLPDPSFLRSRPHSRHDLTFVSRRKKDFSSSSSFTSSSFSQTCHNNKRRDVK